MQDTSIKNTRRQSMRMTGILISAIVYYSFNKQGSEKYLMFSIIIDVLNIMNTILHTNETQSAIKRHLPVIN